MYQLNERVSALFNKTKNCTLSTNGEYPNTIVIMFKEINAQGEILLCDVFMNKTLANLERTPMFRWLSMKAWRAIRSRVLPAGPTTPIWWQPATPRLPSSASRPRVL